MIAIDIPMPQRCVVCPLMCNIKNEREDIRALCRAKEARGDRYVIVNTYAPGRPEDCPIRMGTIKRTVVY
jgi:CxxC motif-containing protein